MRFRNGWCEGIDVRKEAGNPVKALMRFAVVGTLCFGVGIASLYVLTEFARVHYLLSMSIALVIVNLLGWALNRMWTFESSAPEKRQEFARYFAANLAGFGITLILMALLVSGFGVNYLLASMIVAALMMLTNFVVHKNWSFRHRDESHRRS